MSVLPEVLDCREFVNADEIAKGYQVILLFFWLSSPEMAEMRVAQRVASGGHNIPKDVIHRRYWAGLRNLFEIFVPIVDLWSIYDNTKELIPIVERSKITNAPLFTKIKESCQNRKK